MNKQNFVTLCRVERRNGKKRWIVVHNDFDPSSVGEVTACGMPARAADIPLGTEYECALRMPDKDAPLPEAKPEREVHIDRNERGGFECWEANGCGPGKHALFATLPTMKLAIAEVKLTHPKAKLVRSSAKEALFLLPS